MVYWSTTVYSDGLHPVVKKIKLRQKQCSPFSNDKPQSCIVFDESLKVAIPMQAQQQWWAPNVCCFVVKSNALPQSLLAHSKERMFARTSFKIISIKKWFRNNSGFSETSRFQTLKQAEDTKVRRKRNTIAQLAPYLEVKRITGGINCFKSEECQLWISQLHRMSNIKNSQSTKIKYTTQKKSSSLDF